MAKDYKDLVVALDIGTSKVLVVVAEMLADRDNPAAGFKIVGMGQAPTAACAAGWWWTSRRRCSPSRRR